MDPLIIAMRAQNHGLDHDREVQNLETGTTTSSSLFPNLPAETPTPSTNLQSTSSIAPAGGPMKKTRTRKIPTKEISPEDSHALIALGMSPFMPGVDAISNQNRLVRNESILARHISRLQASLSTSESKHTQREQDIYRILTDHTSSIENLRNNSNSSNNTRSCACGCAPSSSILSEPEFAALVQAHVETRNALNAVITKVSASSTSTKRAFEKLKADLSELKSELITVHQFAATGEASTTSSHISSPSVIESPVIHRPSPYPGNTTMTKRSLGFTSTLSPALDVDYQQPQASKRRRRSGSDAEFQVSSTPSLLSPNSDSNTISANSTLSIPNATYVETHLLHPDTAKTHLAASSPVGPTVEVIYGPIINTSTKPRTPAIDTATAEEAIRDVGLSSSTVHSVRPAPAAAYTDCLVIRFLKYDYARRFVDLISLGLDGHPERKASFLKH